MKKYPLKVLTLVACITLVSACSPAGKITLKGVDLSVREVANTTYVDMEAIIVMGNLKFPNIEVPIINPSNLHSLGQMALQSLDDGTNRIRVEVDYEEATRLDPALGKTLPNGRELPSALSVGSNILVGIPILEKSKIYIGGDLKKDLYVGAAISIPALDSILNQVPVPLNIFFNFPFSPQVSGTAGLYTGTQKGQNGVAVFVKKSNLAPSQPTISSQARTLASVESKTNLNSTASGGEELKKMNTVTLIRLDHLLNKRATVKVK